MVTPSFIFSLLAAVLSVGGVLIAFGMLKGKVSQNAEANRLQDKQLETRASKADLAAAVSRTDEQLAMAIKHSDEMLDLMRKRAEEDRASGEGHYRELYGIISHHAERIKAVEITQESIQKILEEIKGSIKTGFTEVKEELKELRTR
jgi:hypothetical protein